MSYSKRPTMHCKVCESAKKPLSVITSHYPKNRDGFTVCPTLLAQQCRGCGKKGHTVGYCTNAPEKQETRQAQITPRPNKKKSIRSLPVVIDVNVLYESSDDEEQEHKQEHKQLGKQEEPKKKEKKVKDPNAKFSWANAESDSSGSDSDSD